MKHKKAKQKNSKGSILINTCIVIESGEPTVSSENIKSKTNFKIWNQVGKYSIAKR
jgi:hypothetical protein